MKHIFLLTEHISHTRPKILEQLIELGQQLGYEGDALQTFVKEEWEAAEKAAEREPAEKAAVREAAERERRLRNGKQPRAEQKTEKE